MKKALITGSQGFVGHYLRQELESNGYEVTGLDLQAGEMGAVVFCFHQERNDPGACPQIQ